MNFKKSSLSLIGTIILYTNCVGWRGVTITAPEKVPQIEYKATQAVTVNIKTTMDGSASFVGGAVEGKYLKESIEKYYKDASVNFIISDDAISNGYLITYNWDRKKTGPAVIGGPLLFLCFLTLCTVPAWTNYDMETKVRVYKAGQVLKEYTYNAGQTDLFQNLLILGTPFAHPNYTTEKIADAVVRRSLEDIKRDIQFK